MSPNRKAELQRKLVLAPVPKPPKGLAERIKSEIPKQFALDMEKERRRFSQSIAFNLRVAASILLLISSVYLCINILSRGAEEKASIARTERILAAPESSANATPPAVVALEEASAPQPKADVANTGGAPLTAKKEADAQRDRPSAIVAEVQAGKLAEHREAPKREETKARDDDRQFIADAVTEVSVAPAAAPKPQSISVTAEAPTVMAPSAPPADAPPPPADLVRQANAADLALGMPSTVFGIAVTEREHAKDKLGARIVGFSAARGVQLEADAAPAPFDDTKVLVRVSIDLPTAEVAERAAIPPIASDANLSIDFDPKNVREQRAIVGATSTNERVLVANSSVTALYELELDPSAARSAMLANVRLSYTSLHDGKKQTITRTIRRSDVAKSWEKASARLKAASLAAAKEKVPADAISAKAKKGKVADPTAAGKP